MKYTNILIIVLLPILLMLSNLTFLIFNKNFYLRTLEKIGVFEEKIVLDQTNELFVYFRGKKELEQNIFSKQARTHLSDVKKLINLVSSANLAIGLCVLLLIQKLVLKKELVELIRLIKTSLKLTVSASILIGIITFTNFYTIFKNFHLVFFQNNLWLFDQNDNLVRLFPPAFFKIFFYQLLANTILCALAILFLSMLFTKMFFKNAN